ncbi:protein CLEC16A-like isoform X3 [Convolutriloba macropyga]|uniref:protein CLEC16A-like isoform X3 n=1 Tax=Convolutriloba macropyga TaxID=536237 RepID=UPI003F51C811
MDTCFKFGGLFQIEVMFSKVLPRWKPKNYHSLENLKYLHMVLVKNSSVTNQNRNLLVETLRSISEIMIWGDQNDSSVFDFFLEKNMLSYFKKIMKQKSGETVCVQLLQTLNILFENISHETSLYFLLSNNHVNSIIVHKFDFTDEEVMAYFISFLKILSLKLNTSTVHLFYNDQIKDFPLLTEALKFFNHSESMVRTAVRTITLSCFRVNDKATRTYICDKIANIYFANLTNDLGKLVLQINELTYGKISNSSMDKLRDLCAEHLDYLSYIQDIYRLDVPRLSEIMTKYLLTGLLLPLYLVPIAHSQRLPLNEKERERGLAGDGVGGTTSGGGDSTRPISISVAMFLTSHVFHIIMYEPLINTLSRIICSSQDELSYILSDKCLSNWSPKLIVPPETIPEFFNRRSSGRLRDSTKLCDFDQIVKKDPKMQSNLLEVPGSNENGTSSTTVSESESDFDFGSNGDSTSSDVQRISASVNNISLLSNDFEENLESTVDENSETTNHKETISLGGTVSQTHSPQLLPPSPVLNDPITAEVVKVIQSSGDESDTFPGPKYISLADRPFLSEIFYSLNCKVVKCGIPPVDSSKSKSRSSISADEVNDQNCLLSVILLLALFQNPACDQIVLERIYLPTQRVKLKYQYNCNLFEYLLDVLTLASSAEMRIRSVTIEMTCCLLRQIVVCDVDPASIEQQQSKLDSLAELSGSQSVTNMSTANSTTYYFITDQHLASLESLKESSCLSLRRFYKSEDMFLDLFESELETSKNKRTTVARIIQDAPIILPPVSTPLSGISANKRLPCGEMELTKLAMGCFFELRNLSLELQNCVDNLLPLAKESDLVKEGDRLNLSNSDLLGCKVITKSGTDERFLVVGKYQLMFVEPDYSTLGWGIVKFTGPLQNTEVTGFPDDNHSLQLTMNRPVVPANAPMSASPAASEGMTSRPLFSAQLKFDDHIRDGDGDPLTRVMAARQRIMRGRHSARQSKMYSIMQILEFPADYIASETEYWAFRKGANAISSSSNNPNSQPHQQQQHYNSYGHSIGGVGGVVSPPYSSYIQTTGSTTTTSSGESTASSRTNHRKNKRASKGHHSSRPNHGVGVDVPGANSKTAGSMQSAGGGSNAGRSQLSSQLSIVNESPTRVQVASKCVETDHNENRNEEHEEARVSSVHSSFVNLGGDTTANPAAARTTPNSPSNDHLLPLSNLTAQTAHYTGTSNYTGDFVGDEVSGQLQEDIAVFDGRSTFPHQWLTSPNNSSEIHESQSLSKAPGSKDGATEGGKLTLLSLAAKAAADNELEPRRGRAETLTFEECEERRKSSSFSNLPAELLGNDPETLAHFGLNSLDYNGRNSTTTFDGTTTIANVEPSSVQPAASQDTLTPTFRTVRMSRSLSHSALEQLDYAVTGHEESSPEAEGQLNSERNTRDLEVNAVHLMDHSTNAHWVPEHCEETA